MARPFEWRKAKLSVERAQAISTLAPHVEKHAEANPSRENKTRRASAVAGTLDTLAHDQHEYPKEAFDAELLHDIFQERIAESNPYDGKEHAKHVDGALELLRAHKEHIDPKAFTTLHKTLTEGRKIYQSRQSGDSRITATPEVAHALDHISEQVHSDAFEIREPNAKILHGIALANTIVLVQLGGKPNREEKKGVNTLLSTVPGDYPGTKKLKLRKALADLHYVEQMSRAGLYGKEVQTSLPKETHIEPGLEHAKVLDAALHYVEKNKGMIKKSTYDRMSRVLSEAKKRL